MKMKHANNKLLQAPPPPTHTAGTAAAAAGTTTSEQQFIRKKGPWTEQEDMKLAWFVRLFGQRRWDFLAKVSGLNRTGKSCRLRWVNYLHPDLKRGRMTPDEERRVLHLHAAFGNRWSRIAKSMPGRTDNEIKNYWRTHLRKHRNSNSTSTSTAAAAATSTSTTTTINSATAAASPDTSTSISSSNSNHDVNEEEEEAAAPMTPSQLQEQLLLYTAAMDDDDQLLIWNDNMDWSGTAIAAPLMPSSPVFWDYCSASLWE